MTYEEIVKNIKARKFSPIYLLMGDEPYYIDEITNLLTASVVPDEVKDFNQTILYGLETNVNDVVVASRRFPMMADNQLIVIKEAQRLAKIEDLEVYTKNPLTSTILVINYKDGTVDKRKKLVSSIEKNGVVFESKKIPDYKMPGFISSFVQNKGLTIDDKSTQILADYLGSDLSKLSNELDKLAIILPADNKRITPEIIEQNIGISKDYNNFELLKAVISKNIFKANQIADYFEKNSRNNPIIMTLSVLFNFFSNLMICYWASDKSENGLAKELNLRSSFMAKDYVQALKSYNAFKCMQIISLLRTYDAKGKGVDNPSTPDGQLLKELLYKIMH